MDLTLNNLQCLICRKTKPNQTMKYLMSTSIINSSNLDYFVFSTFFILSDLIFLFFSIYIDICIYADIFTILM